MILYFLRRGLQYGAYLFQVGNRQLEIDYILFSFSFNIQNKSNKAEIFSN